jgi:hypothetical protein
VRCLERHLKIKANPKSPVEEISVVDCGSQIANFAQAIRDLIRDGGGIAENDLVTLLSLPS